MCEEHIRRKPRDRQRKLAFFSARVLNAAQNDVKFVQTHAVKVFAELFSKSDRNPDRLNHPDKLQFNEKAEKP